MIAGFPIHLISSLRCTSDGATLLLSQNSELSEDGSQIINGSVHCQACCTEFMINDGILNMLNTIVLDEESMLEQRIRNERAIKAAKAEGPAWYENAYGYAELIPTLDAVAANPTQTILELGCGDGRYTVLLAEQCQWVVAVDFSLESLRILQHRPGNRRNIALVLGDITTLQTDAEHFDCALSTLVSNLPTRSHRDAMYRLASIALKPTGRFVFGTHHQGFWQRLRGEAKSGRYRESGIYRYLFTVRECQAEVQSFFSSVSARPIQIHLPFAGLLRLPLVKISRLMESLPLINALGDLILCTAEKPIRYESPLAPRIPAA